MRELMAETGETANLAIADGAEVVFLSQVETHEPIRAFFRLGARGPIHASGIGKALLAYAPPERIERLLRAAPLQAFTPRTLTDPAALRDELAAIRAQGWAIDDEERTDRHALHRGADLQRVPRGDRRGVDLGPDAAGAARARRRRTARRSARPPTASPAPSAASRAS